MKRSRFGQWPLTESTSFPGEKTLQCPFCHSKDIWLKTIPGPFGTAPGGRWRMGDTGGQEVAECNRCKQIGYLDKTNLPKYDRLS